MNAYLTLVLTSPRASWIPALALLFMVVCYARRKQEVGGWLLYFYGWMFALFYWYLRDFLGHAALFLPNARLEKTVHLALILTVIPRLLATCAVVVLIIILSNVREWIWVERLRLMLAVTVVVAGISVALDARYFPGTLAVNAMRLFMLGIWLVYLFVSDRVQRVFRTRDGLDPFASPPTTRTAGTLP
jgi:hypothetical protein